jgi:predicted transcriptional regulator
MKAVTVRLEDYQAERLEHLKAELHNSDAGVLRFALDLLFRTVTEKGMVPADGAPAEPQGA